MNDNLKLFVWDDVHLRQSCLGHVVIALAHNVEEARSMALDEWSLLTVDDLADEPKVSDDRFAFHVEVE